MEGIPKQIRGSYCLIFYVYPWILEAARFQILEAARFQILEARVSRF